MKKFLIYCLFLVLAAASTSIHIQAQENKKDTAEDIKPLSDERWIESDDEKIYKFDINPITPTTGISGSTFIYYGHYIKPPYKIEFSMDFPDGCYIKVNNLCVFPGYIEKNSLLQERINNNFYKNVPKMSAEKERQWKKERKITVAIGEYYKELRQKYDASTQEGSRRIVDELKEYLSKRKDISDFYIETDYRFGVQVPGGSYGGWTHWRLHDFERLSAEKQKEFLTTNYQRHKDHWVKCLTGGGIWLFGFSNEVFLTKYNYIEMIDILKANNKENKENQIKKLYLILHDIHMAKSIYYNYK